MILVNVFIERASVAVLHDEVKIMFTGYLHFDAIYKIFMIRDLLEYFYLGHNRLFILRNQRDYLSYELPRWLVFFIRAYYNAEIASSDLLLL